MIADDIIGLMEKIAKAPLMPAPSTLYIHPRDMPWVLVHSLPLTPSQRINACARLRYEERRARVGGGLPPDGYVIVADAMARHFHS